MPLEPGQILNNRYRIVKLLGQGGFGAVYRGWDMNLNGPCAVKENFSTSSASQQQFAREASMLFNLRHQHLPKVFDSFSVPNQGQYLVMEFIQGEDLEQMMERTGGALPQEQVMKWILQIADALIYLHAQKPPIIHRDIKPANIRITPQGDAMLVDFGIAKVYDPNQKTTMGARAVTPGYSPPEQYGVGSTDAQSDVYALGATMYALLTGQDVPPSVDITAGAVPPPPPAQLVNPAIRPEISRALERAMQINRSARYASVAEFKADLQQAASQQGGAGLAPAAAYAAAGTVVVQPVLGQAPFHPVEQPAASAWPSEAVQAAQAYPEAGLPAGGPVDAPAAPARRKIPVGVWIGGLAALLLLAVCMAGGGIGAYTLFNQDQATATPVAAAASPTRTQAPATHTPIPATPTIDQGATATAAKQTEDASGSATQEALNASIRQTSTALAKLGSPTPRVNVVATEQAQSMIAAVQKLYNDGILATTEGKFHMLDDFEESWAKLGWYQWWETDYDAGSFVITADAAWDSASDKANWDESGCGFVFGTIDGDNHNLAYLGLDGTANLYHVRKGAGKWLSWQRYGRLDTPKGEASIMIVVSGQNLYFFVNDKLVSKAYDSQYVPGPIAYTLRSGTNAGFGTRCEMSNIKLWIID